MYTRQECVPSGLPSRNSSIGVRMNAKPSCDGSALAISFEIFVSQAAFVSRDAILILT